MVIKKIGSVAYQLQSPVGSQVHLVFHVSLLKKKLGKKAISCIELPHLREEGQFLVEPITILERRIVKRRNTPVTQVLVRWSNTPNTNSTWEDWGLLKSRFPSFDPWGQ